MATSTQRLLAPALALLVALAGCSLPAPTGDQGPGAKYQTYLTGGGVLLVELDHAPGNAPSSKVRNALQQELGKITGKQVDLRVSQDLPNRSDSYTYSVDQLVGLHEETQDERDRDGVVVMHAMLVDGRIENDRVAGLAFRAEAFAIAMGTLQQRTCADGALLCTGQPELSNALRAVAVHEAGHLFGLVDITLPMVNAHEMTQDPNPDTPQNEGESHSRNDQSVMWWQVETATQFENLLTRGSQIPYQFDSNDLCDARALRQGTPGESC